MEEEGVSVSGRILGIAAILVTASIALVFWERNPAPQDELEILQREVEETIQRSNADLYAPEPVAAVRDLMAGLQREMEHQLERLPFVRRYDAVHDGITEVRQSLDDLEQQAERNHTNIGEIVAQRIVEAHNEADALEAAIETAPRGKDGSSILRILDDELFGIRELLHRAKISLEGGHVVSAQGEVTQARARTAELIREVRDAEAAVSLEPDDASP